MTNDNLLDQTVCNLPFEVVTIYDNGSQNLQPNTKSNSPPSVNVKIRIRNKENTERRGIISVPRLTAINWPKKVRLVNSAQTIMSFNLAMEQNSDEAQKKSNRRLFQMFKPGGCLSIHRNEDGYSYMPSSSNELKRKSASGIEDDENKITGTFALKKNDFSSSYTNTLKTPKTFMGKCKPGGCLDPPFSEDKYTYKPAVNAQPLQHPVTESNSLQPDINIVDMKHKRTSQDQKQNILFDSYPDTNMVENTPMLVTYPSNLSTSKLKTQDSQIKKLNLRMGEQVDLSRKLTNEFPEAYFIPTRKEKSKNEKSYNKNDYEEKEPKIREAYVNKDYILRSQTPSELLSDVLSITSQPFDEPLKNKQYIRGSNSKKQLLLKSEDILSNNISKDNIKKISPKVSAKDLKEYENTSLQDKNPSNYNNIPIIKNIFSYIKDSKNALHTPISRSSLKVNGIQEISNDIYYKNADSNSNLNLEGKQRSIYSFEINKDISTKFLDSSIDHTKISLHSFEIREKNYLLRQHEIFSNNDISTDGTAIIKPQMEERSEENNNISPVKDKKSVSLEYEYYKNISGQVKSNEIIKNDTNKEMNHPESLITEQKQGDDVSKYLDNNESKQMFENIREPTELLVQDLEFKDNYKMEEPVDQGIERPTEPLIDIHHSVVSGILSKVTSLQSADKILSPRHSHSVLISPENIDVNRKDSLLDKESSKLTELINEKIYTDKLNEPKKNIDILEKKLSSYLITGDRFSQKIEKDTIIDDLKNHDISLKLDKLDDTDNTIIPKILRLNDSSLNNITLNDHDKTKWTERIETVPQSSHEFTDFDSLEYRESLNYNVTKEGANYSNTSINDSKMTLTNLKPDINISKSDILSDDKFRNPSNELTFNNVTSLQTIPNTIFNQEFDKNIDSFLKDFEKSDLDIETSKTKSSQKFDSVQELKILTAPPLLSPIPEIKTSFTDKKNFSSTSSVAINFGFHTSKNEKTGRSIETFDPSISLASYPQDKIVVVKTNLRKNNSEIKVEIDSETDLTMQIKSTRQLKDPRKLAPNILKGYTNEKRRNKVRVHSSETSINKDIIQETLKAVYDNLMTIEKNIVNLNEETESLYREQLLLKNVLFSKEIKHYRITPTVGTCSCLQREIGLE